MFQLYAAKNKLTVLQKELVTHGSVNVYPVQFQFSEDWDGLARVAVFRCGKEARSVVLDETGECVIPWEVLQIPLLPLEAGVYGMKDCDTFLPTVWAGLGTVLTGTSPGDEIQPPTPDVYQQILDGFAGVMDAASAVGAAAETALKAADSAREAAERAAEAAARAQEAAGLLDPPSDLS